MLIKNLSGVGLRFVNLSESIQIKNDARVFCPASLYIIGNIT